MPTKEAIKALADTFPSDRIAIAGTEDELTPAAILLPQDNNDVAKFVKLLAPFVLAGNVEFAVRGVGQQPAPGCSNIDSPGITLDLQNLTGIEIKDGLVSVGAGEHWSAAYEKLTERGLGVTGSRSALGGIGRLALANGLSFFGSREGFICDNVVNYEVVLSSGDIVNASATENPKLWKALLGGGNNFGIITRFDLRTFEQGPFWGGALFYFPPSFPSQVQAYCDKLHIPYASKETHIMISQGYTDAFAALGGHFCMNQAYYTREVEKLAVLEPFVSVQPQIEAMNSLRMMTLEDAAKEQAAQSSDGVRCAYMNTTVKADVTTLLAAAEIFNDSFQPLKELEGMTSAFTLQAYPVSLLEKCNNSLGISADDGPLMSILLLNRWKNKDDDELVIGTFKKALERIDEDAASRGTAVPYKYMNYVYNFQDPIGSYGIDNHQELLKISREYDPEGLFQEGVPGGFKLGKASAIE
ncbi:FAD-binding domain-containing protein [Ophiobolus disseminans]|uniref:FAD-binding domain-containing protein n=1 Tax=Ophiobolus disseminans TaxID=1469910 RepID=A0A6A6ZEP5_9PLEO|nr:FAD-binding domain-containing protein [Ophiobolus disseminans]